MESPRIPPAPDAPPPPPPPGRERRRRPTPTAILFLAFISLPALDAVLRFLPRPALSENRVPAPRPRFRLAEWDAFPAAAAGFAADHFGGRGLLIRWDAEFKVRVLRVSPNPSVVMGSDGWLFLGREDANRDVMDYHRGLRPFSEAELAYLKNTLTERRDWLRSRGIGYLLVLTPDKSTVYPEYLPSGFRTGVRPNRRVQWLRYLRKAGADLPVLDLTGPLTRAKEKGRVFLKSDTHWSGFGAWLGYLEILERLAAGLPSLAPDDPSRFAIRTVPRPGGDLAGMINARGLFSESAPEVRPLEPPRARVSPVEPPPRALTHWSATDHPDRSLPRLVAFMDSFAVGLKDFLAERFSRFFWVRDMEFGFDPDLVLVEKPDVVVEMINERFLLGWAPVNPASIRR